MSATTGPWWVSGRGILAGDTNDPEIVAWFDIDDPMAVCARPDTGIEEAEANARLIAAAPLLRDALRDAAKELHAIAYEPIEPLDMNDRQMVEALSRKANEAWCRARAALAQAEGGA